jgi:aromatic ring-opening dioxygenase catalytic subunit (LigB family)
VIVARIVTAYAMSHILFDPKPAPEAAARIVAGMQQIGRSAAEARPDVLLMVASDHMFNINLTVQPPFCVGVSDDYMALGDMGIPARPFRGHRDFATKLVVYAAARGFDLAMAEGLRPDHSVTLPLLFIKPWGTVPVVPLYVNINMDPVPSPARCNALAEVIRDFIETERPAHERVGVVGSGGLSHWLNIPGAGTVAEEFDEECIDMIIGGRCGEIATMTAAGIRERAGNGGLELLNWMMMARTVPDAKGERIFYEPMPAWQTGLGGVRMTL